MLGMNQEFQGVRDCTQLWNCPLPAEKVWWGIIGLTELMWEAAEQAS